MSKQNALLAVLVTFVFTASMCNAQDVKYCKNAKTGAIIVVQTGYPCPFGTYRT
jgi:hypothetical protein